jgi:hypothetical protein
MTAKTIEQGNGRMMQQQWSLGEVKVIHGSPISIHLIDLEVVAAKKKDGSTILSGSLFFSPIVQLPTTCNILIKGEEKTRGVNHEYNMHIRDHCFVSHDFQLEITQHAYSFEIKVPDHLPGCIGMVGEYYSGYKYGMSTFQVDYICEVSIINKDGRKCVSLPVMPFFQQSSRDDSRQQYQHSTTALSVQVGQKIIIPNSIFCGLLEISTSETFTLTVPAFPLHDSILFLAPCQELSIQIIDGGVLPKTTTSSWKVKFTEKKLCSVEGIETENVQHWELPLDDFNKVKIPICTPSFTGRLLQIHHQMIIIVVMDDGKTIVASTPILPVKVVYSLAST